MPFTIKKNPEGKFCVYKADADGQPTGKTLGCHAKKDDAVDQIGAVEESLSEQGKKSLPSINFYMVPQQLPEISDNNAGNHITTWYEFDDSGTAIIGSKGYSSEELNNDMTKSAEELGSVQEAEAATEEMDTPDITEVKNVEDITEEIAEEDVPAPDPRYALKALGKNRVGTYGILWGDEERKDLHEEFFDEETRDLKSIFDAMGKIPLIVHHGGDESIKTFVYGEVDVMEMDDIGLWYEGKIKEFEVYYNYVKPLMDKNKMFSSSGTLPAAKRVERNGRITRWPIAEMTNTWLPAEYRMIERPLAEIKSAYSELGLTLPDLDKTQPVEADKGNEVQNKKDTKGAEKARMKALIEQELHKLKLSELEL